MSVRPGFLATTFLLVATALWFGYKLSAPPPPNAAGTKLSPAQVAPQPKAHPWKRHAPLAAMDNPDEPLETLGQKLARMDDGEFLEDKLTPVEIAKFLELSRTNSHSLIAAFEATGNKEFLKMALDRFPNTPFIQAQAIMNNAVPERRQELIDALKKNDPQNSLANFLAASDRVKAGDVPGALKEVQESQGKSFDDFFRHAALSLEEAYAAAGRPLAEAKARGSAEILLPELAQMKSIAVKFSEQVAEALGRGDRASAQPLLDWSWEMGRQLRDSGRQGTLIAELVGLAVQNIALQKMEGSTTPDFLGHSVQEEVAQNKSYREAIKKDTALFSEWLPSATEPEIISYFDRMKVLGEREAMRWIRERRPDLVPK